MDSEIQKYTCSRILVLGECSRAGVSDLLASLGHLGRRRTVWGPTYHAPAPATAQELGRGPCTVLVTF